MPPIKPSILAVLPGVMPSTQMDVVEPLLALEQKGLIRLRIALENYPFLLSTDQVDLVVFCRNTEPKYQHILEAVREKRIPYIYDLDDNLFEAPTDTDDGKYYRVAERLNLLEQYLRNAALVRIYSEHLLERIEKLTTNVDLVKPPMEWMSYAPPPSRAKNIPSTNTPIKIVYATSRGNDHLASIFSSTLERVLREFPKKIELHFWGYLPEEFKRTPNVYFHKFTASYKRFKQQFSRAGFEIGLAPLLDDTFHNSKTNNKFREYGACGIAGIYSNTAVYANCVEERKTGLLVDNHPEAWYSAITSLIHDAELRARIGAAARATIEQSYPPGEFQEIWLQQIQMILRKTRQYPIPGQKSAQQSAISSNHIWLEKVGRAISTRDNVNQLLAHSHLHLSNLWWLIKVNAFK